MENKINEIDNKHPTIWIHISSLGEYIMTQPLIDLLLNEYQQKIIYLSFLALQDMKTLELKTLE